MANTDSNTEKLKKIASDIVAEQSKNSKSELVSVPSNKNVPKVDTRSSSSDDNGNIVSSQEVPQVKIDTIGLCGYALPKQTFYLLIIVVIVGLLLWYFNRPKKTKKSDNDE